MIIICIQKYVHVKDVGSSLQKSDDVLAASGIFRGTLVVSARCTPQLRHVWRRPIVTMFAADRHFMHTQNMIFGATTASIHSLETMFLDASVCWQRKICLSTPFRVYGNTLGALTVLWWSFSAVIGCANLLSGSV